MITTNKYREALSGKIKNACINLCSNSIWAFAKIYLPKLFPLPPSIMHKEVSGLLVGCSSNRNKRIVIAEPYQYQLSRLTCLAHILWAICYNKESFIAVVSLEQEVSKDLLRTIKLELTNNKKIKQDFPHAFGRNYARWNHNEIITRNNIKLVTAELTLPKGKCPESDYFGYKYEKPSLIIFDDLTYNEKFEHNPYTHQKSTRYFLLVEDEIAERKMKIYDDLMDIITIHSDSNTNVLITGSMTDCCSAIATIIEEPKEGNWIYKSYPAVLKYAENQDLWYQWLKILADQLEYCNRTGLAAANYFYQDHKQEMLKGAQVLWHEFEDYYSLMEYRYFGGKKAEEDFDCRKQNCSYDQYILKHEADPFGHIFQTYLIHTLKGNKISRRKL